MSFQILYVVFITLFFVKHWAYFFSMFVIFPQISQKCFLVFQDCRVFPILLAIPPVATHEWQTLKWSGQDRRACSQSIACTGSDIGVQQAGRGVAISGARLPICRWTVKGAGLRWEQHGTTWMIVEVNNFRVRLYGSFHTIQKGQLML